MSLYEQDGDIVVTSHQTDCVRFEHSPFPMDFSARLTQFTKVWYRY